jgi:hypothetical protein
VQERKFGGQFPSRGRRRARGSRGEEVLGSRCGVEKGRRGGGWKAADMGIMRRARSGGRSIVRLS